MIRFAWLPLLLLTSPVLAQAGRYDCQGTDAALGAYQGQVELRPTSPGAFDYVRLVTFQAPQGGKTLSTAWIGRAVTRGAELHVLVNLRQLDWLTELNGLRRTSADNAPLVVSGVFRPDPSGGLAGQLQGGVVASEILRRTGAAGAAPLFEEETDRTPMHGRPPALVKTLLFALFRDYHTLPAVAPFTSRADFQDAVHLRLTDRTGFDWLRAHPNQLLLTNKVVDSISLAEADQRRAAYGPRLFEKAAGFDGDAQGRMLDEGLIAFGVRQTPQGPVKTEDMSTWLWSACYAYSQACRFQVTQDPQARDNVLQIAERFCDMIEIDPAPGEFARSLRPINRAPLTGRWHAGAGPFAHLAYHDNGNNDMIKGFWLGFLAAWDVIPPNHPLRPRIQRCVRELADHWINANPSAAGGTGHSRDRPTSRLLNGMLAFYVTGDPAYEQAYKRELRSPRLLLELASGGNVQAYGIADWSGTHLGVCTHIALMELGQRLNSRWTPLFRFSFRPAYFFLGRYYRATMMWSVTAAGYLGKTDAARDVKSGLGEVAYPKAPRLVDRRLDTRWTPSPYPSLPWKRDWMTNAGRLQGLYSEPLFKTGLSNYHWRSGPLGVGNSSGHEYPGADYLFAYWVARRLNVLTAQD